MTLMGVAKPWSAGCQPALPGTGGRSARGRRPAPRRAAPAFTLIEIMMAMVIFSLVITAIYATWTLIIKSAKIGLEASAQLQRQRIAMRTIEESLGCVRSFAADLRHYGFYAENGDGVTLSFVARLPESFPRGGRFGDFDVRRVTFSLENGPDSEPQLVLRQTPILMDPDQDEDEKEHPLVLARGVNKMEFEFWDSRQNLWVDEWTQTNQLPKMMKVTLGFVVKKPNQAYGSTESRQEVSRIVALPAGMVPANYQRGGGPPPGGGVRSPQTPPPPPPPQ
jgi:type II secretion system protein J